MEKYNYNAVNIDVTDNRGTWAEDKPVSYIIAKMDTASNKLSLTVSAPKKVDTTKNPPLVKGDKTGMEVTVRKDGRYGFSWNLKTNELRLIGKKTVCKEFSACMDVLFAHI